MLLLFPVEGSLAAEAAKAFQVANPSAKIICGANELVDAVAYHKVGSFDKVLASPEMLIKLSRQLARSLGPQGLMPNAKRGTVAGSFEEMKEAFEQAMRSSDWRGNKQGFVQSTIGRISFTLDQVRDNFRCLVSSVVDTATSATVSSGSAFSAAASSHRSSSKGLKLVPRPAGVPASSNVIKRVRGVMRQVHLSSSTGPDVKLDVADAPSESRRLSPAWALECAPDVVIGPIASMQPAFFPVNIATEIIK